ncbi:MAG: DUF5916 domain-containing protein, partial [Candidatus Zixiibacteriota bacterium]
MPDTFRSSISWLLAIALLCFSAPIAAQDLFIPNDKPLLSVARCAGSIEIDGDLSDSGWQSAAKAANFAENTPRERVKPAVETEVLVTYDDDNFYMAFICHDDPKTVRASMRDRDEIFDDDYVGILLDTYGDAAWAYEIFVNPLGLQGDLRWVPNGEEDMRFDIVFNSRGRVTEDGWQVEVAVPFSSLRFPVKPIQEWRATFWRNRPRSDREKSTWAAIDRDLACFPCQFGTLVGFENVRPGSRLEILPSIIGFQSAALHDFDNPLSGLDNKNPDGEASLNVRYLLSSDLTADMTCNPDFSQIESDAAQVDVNNNFALFYPEKRPFFQEGSDLFQTYTNVVYTRSINDPIFATKLTGHLTSRTAIGYIGARDDRSPLLMPFEEHTELAEAGKSVSNIARVKQSLGEDSFIGAILTDRRLDDAGSGSAFGADFSLRLDKNYRIGAQFLASHTKELSDLNLNGDSTTFDRGRHTVAFDGEKYWGSSIYAAVLREARLWNFELEFIQASPTFRADNGFVFRNNQREGGFWTGLFFRPKSKVFIEVSPTLSIGRIWNFSGARKDEWFSPELSLLLPLQTQVQLGWLYSRETFQGQFFPGIRHYRVYVDSRFSDPVSLGGQVKRIKYIARQIKTPVLGEGWEFEAFSTIKLLQRLIIRPEYSYSELNYPNDGGKIYSGYILRTQLNYQFSREWFLRLIVQYDNFERVMALEPLLSYKLNPFSIFYLGS